MRLKSSDDETSYRKYTFISECSLHVMQTDTPFCTVKSRRPYFCVGAS